MSDLSLTAAQCARYGADGFVVVPGVLSSATCEALRERARELAAMLRARAPDVVFESSDGMQLEREFLASARGVQAFFEPEPGRVVNKVGHALHALDPVFAELSARPAWHMWARQLGVGQPKTCQSMLIFKQPGIGGAVQCHQDATYLHTEPTNLVGLWMALEDATVDNGCLWALPGGHRQGLKKRFVQREGGGNETMVLDATPFDGALVPLEVAAGSVVVLHGLCPHASYANRSSTSRLAYTLHVIDLESAYSTNNWLQDPP